MKNGKQSGKKHAEMELGSDEDVPIKSTKKTNALASKKKQQAKAKDSSFEKVVSKVRGVPDGGNSDNGSRDVEMKAVKKGGKLAKTNGTGTAIKSMKKASPAPKKLQKYKTGAGEKRKAASAGNEGPSKKAKIDMKDKKKGEIYKENKKLRKQTKKNYELATNIKMIWEDMRKIDLPAARRKELSEQLYETVKGKSKELIFAHDTSRVIQCLMKYGAQEQKDALFEELKDSLVHMLKSKYAKFYVRRLFKYGLAEQKNYIFKQLSGHARKLLTHRESADLIELAYSDYANAQQRSMLVNEFYGPSIAVFKRGSFNLADVVKQEPEKRDIIMKSMKESLQSLVDKSILQYSLVHRLFVDFFTIATESLRAEMIETVREALVHMLHTRDGARLAMKCIWFGNAKDRKVIVKSFKTFVAKICKDEYGHLVMLALFDSVDDTKLVQKAILDELLKSVDDVAKDQFGRKVLYYLLAPRDPHHFHPDIISIVQEGDGNTASKKDAAVRRKELLDYVSGPLVTYTAQHAAQLAVDNALLLLILTVISHVTCDPREAMLAVAKLAAEPYTPNSDHLVEHTAGHLTLKHLIQNDSKRIKAAEQVLFSTILLDTVAAGSLRSWAASNRGCFILITLLELGHAEISQRVNKELGALKGSLKKMDFKGAQILAGKL